MDERKKTIRELELRKNEALILVNETLERLGDTLLNDRSGDGEDGLAEFRAEYGRITEEIRDTRERIKSIETDVLRSKEAEAEIRLKEQEYNDKNKELSILYTSLGELVIDDPEFAGLTGSLKPQMNTLVPKIQSLEERLDELEENSQSNVFAWIGKSTQGMVIRSLLGKSRGSLQRVYTAAGEQFAASFDSANSDRHDVLDYLDKIEELRRTLASLTEALTALREERRKLDDFLAAEGSPARKTQDLERHLVRTHDKLKELYRSCGAGAATGAIQISLTQGDTEALEKIKKLRETIREDDNSIEKLKASLAIDAQREEVDRLEKAIIGQRQRIAACEETISDLETRIKEANSQIQELMKI
jgi:chromosome segregation ATPase